MEKVETLSNLVAQTKQYHEIMMNLEGNITDVEAEVESLVTAEELKLPAKLDGYAIFINRMRMESTYWKSVEKEAKARAKTCETTADFMEERIKAAATTLETSELNGFEYKFKISKSKPSVCVVDESKIDSAYFDTKTEKVLSKTRIADDLKRGVPVEGTIWKEGQSLKITLNNKKVRGA